MTVLSIDSRVRLRLFKKDRLMCCSCEAVIEDDTVWLNVREGINGEPTVFWIRCKKCHEEEMSK